MPKGMTPLLALQRNNLTIPSYKDLLTLDLKYYEKNSTQR